MSFVPPSITFICFQVKEELDLAGDETKVFKLIGPALVNQDLSEAKGNVEKRIEYIRYQRICYCRILLCFIHIISYYDVFIKFSLLVVS